MTMLYKLIAILAALLAMVGGLFWLESHIEQRGYDRAQAECKATRAELKAQASATLAAETEKTRRAEQALNAAKNKQELKDVANQKTVAALSDRLRLVAGPDSRLRDPNAPQCGPSGGSPPSEPATAAAAGAADRAETGGLLSEELSGLLQRLTREADDINAAYASCRPDALRVRELQ